MITVAVREGEGMGALVSEIALYDVHYRYADSGGRGDPIYPAGGKAGFAFGALDGSAITTWGTLPYQSARRDLLDNDVRYQFDGLRGDKRYKVHLSFYQGSGTTNRTRAGAYRHAGRGRRDHHR